MAEYKTPQRIEEVNAIAEILRTTYKKFAVDVEVTGMEYGPRTGLLHCTAPGLEDMEKVKKLAVNIEYALGRYPITINLSRTQKNSFEVIVPFDGALIFPEWTVTASQSESVLSVPLGVAVSGEQQELNLETAQHILMAGSTGSGKSTVMHSIICSLIRKHTPETLKLALMDPKRVELTLHNNLPYLVAPVVVDSEPASQVFIQLKEEMDQRLKVGSQERASLPKILIVVDEFSDFMCSEYAASIEENVLALTEKGHTVGMHIILSTSRPSTNIYTEKIRKAFPSRIVGLLASATDSITMLETLGGEKLLGKGDMLLRTPEQDELIRFQALHISTDDIIKHIAPFKKA